MRSVSSTLRTIKFRYPDGSVVTLKNHLKKASKDDMKRDIEKMLETTASRVNSTDNKRVLTDLYAILLSLNVGTCIIIDIAPEVE